MSCSRTTTQWRRWGSNLRPFGLESSTLPLSHCAPILLLSADNLFKQFKSRSGPTKCRAWSGSNIFVTWMVLKKFSTQRVKYSTIIRCEGIKKAIFENPKADQYTLFCKYVIFEPPRVFFEPMTYICNHSTFLVANGYNGYWQGEPCNSTNWSRTL